LFYFFLLILLLHPALSNFVSNIICFCLGSAKDEKEVVLCIEELNAPNFYPFLVSLWVNDSFERKDMERELLAKLLVSLCSGRHNLLSKQQLSDGYVLSHIF
jgi:hypothetical protein